MSGYQPLPGEVRLHDIQSARQQNKEGHSPIAWLEEDFTKLDFADGAEGRCASNLRRRELWENRSPAIQLAINRRCRHASSVGSSVSVIVAHAPVEPLTN